MAMPLVLWRIQNLKWAPSGNGMIADCLPQMGPWEPGMQVSWIWASLLLVAPGAIVCIGFTKRYGNGGRGINGMWVIKDESQKTSLYRRQRAHWKETFYSGQECVSFWFIWNYPKEGPPGGLLQGALCPFQGSFLRSSSSASQFTFRAYGFD